MNTTARTINGAVKTARVSALRFAKIQAPQLPHTFGSLPTAASITLNQFSTREHGSEYRSKRVKLPQQNPGYGTKGPEGQRSREADVKESTKPESTRTLHLFRALLRQASYLPDPASRKYFHAHIRSRFRDYCPRGSRASVGSARKRESGPEKEGSKVKILPKRQTRMLAQARQELVFLKKANAGCPNSLQKVLELTYGRRGKRKHDLLINLRIPKPSPMDNKDLAKLMEALESEGNPSKISARKLPLFSDKFIALVKSQMKQKHALFSKAVPKSNAPQVPETNSWGRPLPIVRIKNITKKWYAETLERLMPPLPESEWKHLEELTTGNLEWTRRPQRVRGTGSWEESHRGLSESLKRQAHELTPRYMRRMWARVFVQCPLMRWNSDRLRWDVQWGRVDEQKGLVLSTSKPLAGTAFEGVDVAGRMLKAPKDHTRELPKTNS